MRLIVSIPTTNRRAIIGPTVRDIARQTRVPDLVMVVVADPADIDPASVEGLPFALSIVLADRGSSPQRNRALEASDGDIVLFLDDDFVMAPDYLANMERVFAQDADVVLVTGDVLADGIHGPGLALADAVALTTGLPTLDPAMAPAVPIYNGYGCNMAVRVGPVLAHGVRFDTRLALYAWLEDVDFSRQMARFGRVVKSPAMRGVHLGTKIGRSNGLRVGYSQIANPLYLNGKGTMSLPRALNQIARNLGSNLVKSLRPEPEIDRRGRLRGNLRAIKDLLRGRLRPEEVANL